MKIFSIFFVLLFVVLSTSVISWPYTEDVEILPDFKKE